MNILVKASLVAAIVAVMVEKDLRILAIIVLTVQQHAILMLTKDQVPASTVFVKMKDDERDLRKCWRTLRNIAEIVLVANQVLAV